jgi:hypothetical protein
MYDMITLRALMDEPVEMIVESRRSDTAYGPGGFESCFSIPFAAQKKGSIEVAHPE